MLPDFWTLKRLNGVAIVLVLGLAIAVIWSAIYDVEQQSQVWRGDFPGFYVLAEIVRTGQAQDLYKPELQQAIENQYWPSFNGGFLMSVYPPYVAALLIPLAYMNPAIAKIFWSVVSLLLFVLSFKLISVAKKREDRSTLAAIVGLFSSLPVLSGVIGGQLSALVLLLISSIVALSEARITLGILVGLLMIKPQIGVIMFFFLLLTRNYKAIGASICTYITLYLIGAWVFGIDWVWRWVPVLRQFSRVNFDINWYNQTSLVGLQQALLNKSEIAAIVTLVVSVCILFMTAKRFIDLHYSKVAWMLCFAVVPLISPQVLYYDLSIGLLAAVYLTDFNTDKKITLGFLLVFLNWILFYYRKDVGFPPGVIIAAILWLYSYRQSFNAQSEQIA